MTTEAKNLIVVPPHYEGTSFEEMAKAMSIAADGMPMDIEVVGQLTPMSNDMSGELLDDERYVTGQLTVLSDLTRRKMAEKVLFLDFFNPGLDLIRYAHLQKEMCCKYGAILSGGTFMQNDLYSFEWLKSFEAAWTSVYDRVYASTKYIVPRLPSLLREKTKILPFGMDAFQPSSADAKKHDILFPHRLNSDKGIEEFIAITKKVPEHSIVIPIPQAPAVARKNQFHEKVSTLPNVQLRYEEDTEQHGRTLAESTVVLSCAKQELFGYSVMKSVLSGCFPVLPNDQCYPDFFPKDFLYEDVDGAVALLRKFLNTEGQNAIAEPMRKVREHIRSMSFKEMLRDFFEKE